MGALTKLTKFLLVHLLLSIETIMDRVRPDVGREPTAIQILRTRIQDAHPSVPFISEP